MRWFKPTIFACATLPVVKIAADAARGGLTANPVSEVLNRLGFWALFFLLLSLAPTPLKTVAGLNWPLKMRRMIGLFALFYASAHFATYVGVDQFFAFGDILKDIVKRPFITVGFVTLLILIPLGVTSTNPWVKRMGFKRWKRLHRFAYLAAVLGVIHFIWRVKSDLTEPLYFLSALALLFAFRIVAAARGRAVATQGRAN